MLRLASRPGGLRHLIERQLLTGLDTCAGYNVRYNACVFTAKVTTIGNSLGIVLPREILSRLRVDKGDLLFLVESPLGFELTPYQPDFVAQMQQAEQLMRSERDVLRLLVDPRPAAQAPAGVVSAPETKSE